MIGKEMFMKRQSISHVVYTMHLQIVGFNLTSQVNDFGSQVMEHANRSSISTSQLMRYTAKFPHLDQIDWIHLTRITQMKPVIENQRFGLFMLLKLN